MEVELPSEIKKALELFKEFERSKDHSIRVKCFKEAVDKTNDYLEKNPDNQFSEIILNMQSSYTRKLLEQLDYEFNLPPIENEWIGYLFVLIKIKKIRDNLTKESTELQRNWSQFINAWREDIKYLISEYSI
ncbi:MAG: hypothetical protein QQN41_09020 [Nitrosopumilus sp.]